MQSIEVVRRYTVPYGGACRAVVTIYSDGSQTTEWEVRQTRKQAIGDLLRLVGSMREVKLQ